MDLLRGPGALCRLRNQTPDRTLSAPFAPGVRFPVFDFGKQDAFGQSLSDAPRCRPTRVLCDARYSLTFC
eukprot:3013455-Rhodomonas_salina.1